MSEDQLQDDQDVESVEETSPPPGVKYYIHNTSRSRHNRAQRYASASHRGLKQHLGGGTHRIVRARPLSLTEAQFTQHLAEIKERVKAGLLEVRLVDGSKVDVDSLEVTPALPSPPLPNFPIDSVANDANKGIGEVIPPYVGDDQHSLPAVLPDGKLPGVLEKKAQEEQAAAEAKKAEEEAFAKAAAEAAEKKAAADEELSKADDAAIEKAISESGDDPPQGDTEVMGGVSSSKGSKSRRNK